MQGDAEIIEVLNEILTAELTAINQYFIHAKMREDWGFVKIAEKARDESIDEMKDAEKVIDRILYLDGVPNLQRYDPVLVGETVPEQYRLELETETRAIERYNRAAVAGMVGIMSKMGISTMQSYHSAQIFEAVGLDHEFVDDMLEDGLGNV